MERSREYISIMGFGVPPVDNIPSPNQKEQQQLSQSDNDDDNNNGVNSINDESDQTSGSSRR